MAQVKFYSVASLPESPNAGGVYFVDNGELYKGGQRFGLGRVTVDADFVPSTSSKDGQARGDIVVTGSGAGWVFDGENWQSIGGDIASLQSMWQADISTWTAGLATTGEDKYITGITQGADGKVTAATSTFSTDVKTAIGDGAASSTANGITVSVVTTSGSVTGVEVAAANISATSGTFENLTVTDTATFSATTVSADTLTIGGSTVEQLADKQIAAISASTVVSASNGITVSVTTQGGSVTAVSLNAEAFGNTIHFRGVEASTGAVSDPVAGDIVVIGSTPGEGFVAGQEYIYDGTKWELIGDQNTYAVNAYSSTATVFTGVETVPGALNAAGAAIDALKTKTDAYVGGSASDADQGVAVTVSVDATTLAPSVDVVVTSATLFDGLDATVSSAAKGVEVEVVEENGKLTSATVAVTASSEMAFGATGSANDLATTAAVKSYFENNLVWLGADGNPVDGGSTPDPAKTRFTIQGGPVREHNISGSLDRQWLDSNEYYDGENSEWLVNILQVDIGNTVTSIGSQTFDMCGDLTSVTIPDTVTNIDMNAFMGCNNLTSVTITANGGNAESVK